MSTRPLVVFDVNEVADLLIHRFAAHPGAAQ